MKNRKKDKFIFLWVYDDGDDSPWVIRNPPRNLAHLLRKWNKLDDAYIEAEDHGGAVPEDWQPVNHWLAEQGVEIIEADKEIALDDYRDD